MTRAQLLAAAAFTGLIAAQTTSANDTKKAEAKSKVAEMGTCEAGGNGCDGPNGCGGANGCGSGDHDHSKHVAKADCKGKWTPVKDTKAK